MTDELVEWRSPDGQANAVALRAAHPGVFAALSEFDRMGHLTLHRAASGDTVETVEGLVGVALLRRSVAVFAALRQLLESSLPDPAVVLLRTYWEIWLQYRCLAYGTEHPVSLETATTSAQREPRAIRFYLSSLRRGLRSRALIVGPDSRHSADSPEGAARLEEELRREIKRLRETFPDEWEYFGDLDEGDLVRRIVGREEPAWFADLIEPRPSSSIAALARTLGASWEYDFLYEAWSAFAHGRGISKDLATEGNEAAVHHPHRPTWFELVAFLALSWHGLLLMTAAKWLTPVMIPHLQDLYTAHRATINGIQVDEDVYKDFID